MAEKLTKEKVEALMSLEGEARGMHLTSDRDFVLREEGAPGLKKLEERLAELGQSFNYHPLLQYPPRFSSCNFLHLAKFIRCA